MTEALIKDIKLVGGKECDRLIKEAFSEENRRRVEHFNKYERPKLRRPNDYLYVSNADKSVAAYITLGIKSLLTDDLSDETIKFLDGYTSEILSIPCYLVAQLGKSDTCKEKIGKFLLDDALAIIDKSHNSLKGRFVLIDAVNDDKVINFYKESSFIVIENDKSLKSIKMIKPYFEYGEFEI